MFCWNCKKELTAGTLVCPCCGASIQINTAMTGTYVNQNLNNQQTTIYTNSPKQEKSKIKRVITAIRTGQKIKGLLLCDLIDIIVNTLLIGPIIA